MFAEGAFQVAGAEYVQEGVPDALETALCYFEQVRDAYVTCTRGGRTTPRCSNMTFTERGPSIPQHRKRRFQRGHAAP